MSEHIQERDSCDEDPPDVARAGALAVAWAVLPATMGFVLLSQIEPVSAWLLANPFQGFVLYVIAFAVTSGLGLLPTYAQSVLGGWVFGPLIGIAGGTSGALLGFAGGALIGYIVSRLVARNRVEKWIEGRAKADAVRQALVGRGFWPTLGIVALVRLPPNSPFSVTNLALASTGVPLPAYLAGTVLGMTPRTALAVGLAAAAAATGAQDIQSFIREQGWLPFVIGLAALLGAIGVIGVIAKRALDRVSASAGRQSDPAKTKAGPPMGPAS